MKMSYINPLVSKLILKYNFRNGFEQNYSAYVGNAVPRRFDLNKNSITKPTIPPYKSQEDYRDLQNNTNYC